MAANEQAELWVAEVDGRAKGFLLLEFTRVWGQEGEAFDELAAGIDWFDVHPDFQRRGVGTLLLRKAEERAKRRRLSCLFAHTAVTNLRMINFAAKNGFVFSSYLSAFWGPGTRDAFLLVKRL